MGACPTRHLPIGDSVQSIAGWVGSVPPLRRTSPAGEVDLSVRRHRDRLELLAGRPDRGAGALERSGPQRAQVGRDRPEARISHLTDQIELPAPCLDVRVVRGVQAVHGFQVCQGADHVLVEPGALVDVDHDDGELFVRRAGPLEPGTELSNEPSLLDVGVLTDQLELGEVVAAPGGGAVGAAAREGQREDDRERSDAWTHDGSVSATPFGRQPLKETSGPPETGRMPHRDLRVVLEWLGLLEPERSRREPVALPRWAPWAVALVAVGAAAAAAALLGGLLGLGG